MSWLLEPFGYHYMLNAMWVSALVGGVCAFLSCYLMLKGWSLIGDALSHSIVPGVAGAYMLGLPFALGAFLSGGLAAGSMLFLQPALAAERGCHYRADLLLLLRDRAVYGVAESDVGEYPDHHPRQYSGHRPGGYYPAGGDRLYLDGDSAAEMERPDGDLFDETTPARLA
jgi:hypothetical protein